VGASAVRLGASLQGLVVALFLGGRRLSGATPWALFASLARCRRKKIMALASQEEEKVEGPRARPSSTQPLVSGFGAALPSAALPSAALPSEERSPITGRVIRQDSFLFYFYAEIQC
jgi:hypothetical protein